METSQRPPPLLRLPKELRIEIFNHLFLHTHCYLQIYENNLQLCRAFSQNEVGPLPLLLTCKILCKEVQDVLYENTLFDVQLHMQHLPLTNPSGPGPSAPSFSTITKFAKENRGKYGAMPVLNLPIKMRLFLTRIKKLALNVWVYDAGTAQEMSLAIESIKASLFGPTGKERIFMELKLRLRLRPRWLQKSDAGSSSKEGEECETMRQGGLDEVVSRLMELKCTKLLEWTVEEDVKALSSEDCWEEKLAGKAKVVK